MYFAAKIYSTSIPKQRRGLQARTGSYDYRALRRDVIFVIGPSGILRFMRACCKLVLQYHMGNISRTEVPVAAVNIESKRFILQVMEQ